MKSVLSVFDPIDATSSEAALMRLRCDSQSLNFYGDLSRYICKFFLGYETLSLLDVGPRTGAGLALLRLIHHPLAFTRLKFDPVHGVDLDPEFVRIAETEFRDIKAEIGDIFEMPDRSFDIVTCSHTIEHIEDPGPFVEKLAAIARRALFIACPFDEKERIPDHCVSITGEFLSNHQFEDVEIYESNHWHNGLCCLAYRNTAG